MKSSSSKLLATGFQLALMVPDSLASTSSSTSPRSVMGGLEFLVRRSLAESRPPPSVPSHVSWPLAVSSILASEPSVGTERNVLLRETRAGSLWGAISIAAMSLPSATSSFTVGATRYPPSSGETAPAQGNLSGMLMLTDGSPGFEETPAFNGVGWGMRRLLLNLGSAQTPPAQ